LFLRIIILLITSKSRFSWPFPYSRKRFCGLFLQRFFHRFQENFRCLRA
jgi:hypothetical protein